MTQTSVITVRIRKEIKETLERAGINIPEVVKQRLEELSWKLQLKEETERMRKILENVKPSEAENRESH
jgi:rRNA-processing protein FCF1